VNHQNRRDNQAQQQLQIRLGHLLRGLVLIYALSLPRIFYYMFVGYALLVMSGLFDKLRGTEFRQYWAGSRPSLDLQLTRLRQRMEYIQKLKSCPPDDEDAARMREFLAQFNHHRAAYHHRFIYQLVVMFFYSAFPACHPHVEYLT
jgi:hypothetical protein